MDTQDQNRILESVKDSITSTTDKTEESASYFIIGLAVAIIVGTIVIVASVSSKRNQIATYDQQIQTDVNDPLKSLEKEQKQISSVFAQIDTLEQSLDSKIKYSQIFSDLVKNQYKKSKWSSVTVKDGTISITGEADNFEDVARTVAAFKTLKSAKSVNLTTANIDQEKQAVSFVIELTLDLSEYKGSISKTTSTDATSGTVTQ